MANDEFVFPKDYSLEENPKLKNAYELLKAGEPCVLLTGGAGTGKSTFIHYVKKNFFSDTEKNCAVLSPTGVASVNVGGQTIHSFFRFPPRDFENSEIKNKNPVVEKIDLLIIDEISQVESAMIDHIDFALKKWRKNAKPFGGVQMLFSGDYFQLSPWIKYGGVKENFLNAKNLKSQFFFDAHVFEKIEVVPIILEKIYRQNDLHFIKILNDLRICDDENTKQNAILELNEKCLDENSEIPNDTLFITTTNEKANEKNQQKLQDLLNHGKREKIYVAKMQNIPENRTEDFPAPKELLLCEGAKVMVTKNIYGADGKIKVANGDVGFVEFLDEEKITVKIKNSFHEFSRQIWEIYEYIWNEKTKTLFSQPIGRFSQFPLRLGWAITIHKSQGMTLDSVAIEAGEAFSPGQVYVALSRCKTLSGITLKEPLKGNKVFSDERVRKFHNALKNCNEKAVKFFEAMGEEIQEKNQESEFIEVGGIGNSSVMLVNVSKTDKYIKTGSLSVYEAIRGMWCLFDELYEKAKNARFIAGFSYEKILGLFAIEKWQNAGTDEEYAKKFARFNFFEHYIDRYECVAKEIPSNLKGCSLNVQFEKGKPVQFFNLSEIYKKLDEKGKKEMQTIAKNMISDLFRQITELEEKIKHIQKESEMQKEIAKNKFEEIKLQKNEELKKIERQIKSRKELLDFVNDKKNPFAELDSLRLSVEKTQKELDALQKQKEKIEKERATFLNQKSEREKEINCLNEEIKSLKMRLSSLKER